MHALWYAIIYRLTQFDFKSSTRQKIQHISNLFWLRITACFWFHKYIFINECWLTTLRITMIMKGNIDYATKTLSFIIRNKTVIKTRWDIINILLNILFSALEFLCILVLLCFIIPLTMSFGNYSQLKFHDIM